MATNHDKDSRRAHSGHLDNQQRKSGRTDHTHTRENSARSRNRKNGDQEERRRRREGRTDYRQSHTPKKFGYREERQQKFLRNEPSIPDDVQAQELDPMVLQDLKVLSKDNADVVAKHLICCAMYLDEDPELAARHAQAAKARAGRVAVVRETAGIAAYHIGDWKEALSELRAARRMSGGPGLLAVMADAERGLGKPDKAIELAASPEARQLDAESSIELAIVVAGAHADMGQYEEARKALEVHNPKLHPETLTDLRLSYAYADALVSAGESKVALERFAAVASADTHHLTDAADRVAELEGTL